MLATVFAWNRAFRVTERTMAAQRSERAVAAGKPRKPDIRSHLPRELDGKQTGSQPAGGFAADSADDAAKAISSNPRFETRTWSGPEGARDYHLYVPATLHRPVRGLIVMLHGCKQDPRDFAIGTGMNALAEDHGLIVAYPCQSRTDSPLRCWNWFRPGNQHRGEGEPAILAGIAEDLMTEFSVDRSNAFIAGLSAGGAMAAIMGDCYPDLFSAVGVHSGLPCHSALGTFSALALMNGRQNLTMGTPSDQPVRTIVFQGTADRTVHPDNAELIATAARAGVEVETERATGKSEGGRLFGATASRTDNGNTLTEVWLVEGASHGWSGGSEAGSYTDPAGPDASAEMLRFFLEDLAPVQ